LLKEVEVTRVDDWPRSMAVGLTEIVGNERAAFTVTVAVPDVTVASEFELSVTCSSKDQDPRVDRVPVEVDADDKHVEGLPKLM